MIIKTIKSTMKLFGIEILKSSTLNQLIQQNLKNKEEIKNLKQNQVDLKQEIKRNISNKWLLVDHLIEKNIGALHSSIRCPLCSYDGERGRFKEYVSECIFGGGKLLRLQCPDCDVIFGSEKIMSLSDELLSSEYELHYQVYEEGDSTENEIRAFHSLKPIRAGVYLNYGAGNWSKSVESLREDGWNIYSYEPHDSARGNLDYCISSFEELSSLKFDGIFTNNVIEHFKDPIGELRLIKSVLKPGGRVAHVTPCYEYLYEYTRFHLFFFLGRSVDVLAELSGLEKVDHFRDGDYINYVFIDKEQ